MKGRGLGAGRASEFSETANFHWTRRYATRKREERGVPSKRRRLILMSYLGRRRKPPPFRLTRSFRVRRRRGLRARSTCLSFVLLPCRMDLMGRGCPRCYRSSPKVMTKRPRSESDRPTRPLPAGTSEFRRRQRVADKGRVVFPLRTGSPHRRTSKRDEGCVGPVLAEQQKGRAAFPERDDVPESPSPTPALTLAILSSDVLGIFLPATVLSQASSFSTTRTLILPA